MGDIIYGRELGSDKNKVVRRERPCLAVEERRIRFVEAFSAPQAARAGLFKVPELDNS